MRIVSAREQHEAMVFWRREAAEVDTGHGQYVDQGLIDKFGPYRTPPAETATRPPGHPGQGNPAVLPKPKSNIGDPDAPWAQHDWRQAVADGTYGHFNSPARPPSSGDTPHPKDLLAGMKPYLTNRSRTLTIEDEDDPKKKKKVSRPSWREMIENAKEPDLDPAGLLPPNETVRQHVEHMKERIRRGRGYGSPGDPVLPPPGTDGSEYANSTNLNVDHHAKHLQDRVKNGPHEDNGGKFWYDSAHERDDNLARETHGDRERVTGTDSALSPLKDWNVNTEQSAHFNTHYPYGPGAGVGPVDDPIGESPEGWRVPAPNAQNSKSRRILDAPEGTTRSDIAEILQGPKTESFLDNIGDDVRTREPRNMGQAHKDFMAQHGDNVSEEASPYFHGGDPELAKAKVPDDEGHYPHKINPHTGQPDFRYGDQGTTGDTHHVRAHSVHPDADLSDMSYGTPDWFSDKMVVNGQTHHVGYELSQRINQMANAELNFEELDAHRHTLPKQGQATGWKQWKGGLDDAGKGAGTAEPGTAPKGYDETKKNFGLGELNKGTDPKTKKPIKDPNPAPKHEYDIGDWNDPRRPPPGKAFKGDWRFEEAPEGSGQKGKWIPPERATTTYTNDPKRGDPQSITHNDYSLRSAPNYQRRPKDDAEWRDRDYNQYLTDIWGDPGDRGRWASVNEADRALEAAREVIAYSKKFL